MSESLDKVAALLKLIASNVVYFRKLNGLTQDDLAAKAGIDRTYIGYIENAKQNITLSKLTDIADALGVTIGTLMTPNPEALELLSDLDKVNIGFPYLREYQKIAAKHEIYDIFQDNGGKLIQVLLVTGLINIKSREGNDAKNEEGKEFELKSVNIGLTNQFSTHHHLNPTILKKYRLVDWVFAVYEHIELKEIYYVTPDALEPLFSRWEAKWHSDGGKDINNPKIPLKFVKSIGKLIFSMPEDGQLFRIKL